MPDFIIHEGARIFVQGYAAPYNSLSFPLDSLDGKSELILPGAFGYALQHKRECLSCQPHHLGTLTMIGSIFHGTLQIWSDSYGLAFSCGPFPVEMRYARAIASIIRGEVRGCSWRGLPAEVATEQIDGEQVVVIKKVQYLAHIAPTSADCAVYPGAAVWCSHEHVDDLPDHLKPLTRHWQANHPPARQALPARAAKSKPELAAAAHYEAMKRHPARQPALRRSP